MHYPKKWQPGDKPPTSIKPDDVFKKLVLSPRGGWCFEQNSLLFRVFKHFNFKVYPHVARPCIREPRGYTHLSLQVHLQDGIYVVDAGFGTVGGLRHPLPLRLNDPYTDPVTMEMWRFMKAGAKFDESTKWVPENVEPIILESSSVSPHEAILGVGKQCDDLATFSSTLPSLTSQSG